MARPEIEGGWFRGWPDRKRHEPIEGKDSDGRTIFAMGSVTEMQGRITPTDLYYVVAQIEMPEPMHPDDWEMEICGEVETPIKLKLSDLKKLPPHTVRAVTECAGNGAPYFDYLHKGGRKPSMIEPGFDFQAMKASAAKGASMLEELNAVAPSLGIMSTGEFSGVRLRDVLKLAGVKPNTVALRFQGFDRGRPDPSLVYLSAGRSDIDVKDPGVINYDKGLPIEKALHPDTLLAWSMNGEYLRHVHGAPLRLVVPGWSGNWWVKWIEKIEAMDHMPECYHQTEYFVLGESHDDPNKIMCTALGVKTIIVDPLDEDSPLKCGSHAVRGYAWSGEGKIIRVEVSVDGGKSWEDANIEESTDRWLWIRWTYVWDVNEPGAYQIMSRGTDENGRVQPQIPFNYQRKHFDGIVPTDIVIE